MRHPAWRSLVALLFGFLSLHAAVGAAVRGEAAPPQAPGIHEALASVTIRVDLSSHTSLRLSSSELRFDVTDPAASVRSGVDFVAAARTYAGGDVVLTVEPDGGVQVPEGVDGSGVVVTLSGDGRAIGTEPHVAGKWSGSGVRRGRLEFLLTGARANGVYRVPVKFILSAP